MSQVTKDQRQVSAQDMLLNAENPAERKMLIAERQFHLQQRHAMVLSESDVVPTRYQKKIANCLIAMEMAERLGTGTLEIMQNLYVVHGTPAFSAKYAVARLNTSGLIEGELEHHFVGTEGQDDWGCYCTAISAKTGKEVKGPVITIQTAKDEGWYQKTGSKWKTIPELMLQYRAASWLINTKFPQATLGFSTVDEVRDSEEKDITPRNEPLEINEKFKPRAISPNPKEEIDTNTGEVSQSPEASSEQGVNEADAAADLFTGGAE